MTTNEFSQRIVQLLSALPYISNISISPGRHQIKGQATLEQEYTLFFSYHELSFKLTFALIAEQGRIWGLDKHPPLGWHRHPLHSTEQHQAIPPRTLEEIVEEIDRVFAQLVQEASSVRPSFTESEAAVCETDSPKKLEA